MRPEGAVITCSECNRPTAGGLNEVRDFHGNTFTVCCGSCASKIMRLLDRLFAKYGGIRGKCSCQGSPHITSSEHLRTEVGT